MNTILIIAGIAVIVVGVVIFLVKRGKIADSDGDLIPDVVEDAVDDVKSTTKEVKRRAKRVADEFEDVVDEAKDVVDAAKGKKSKKVTKSSLRTMKKAKLIDIAKKEFNVNLNTSLTKTNLINKVYELYNKK